MLPVSYHAAGIASTGSLVCLCCPVTDQYENMPCDVSGAAGVCAVPPAVWGVLLRRLSPV